MKRQSIAISIALALLVVAANLQSQDDSKTNKALAELQGVWKLTAVEHDGGTREFAERAPHWVVKGSKIYYGGEELAKMTADAATSPKCIDFVFRAPHGEREAIYALKDGAWKICVNWDAEGVKERPQDFSTKDKPQWRVLNFEKVNTKETDVVRSGMGYVGIQIRKGEDGGLFIAMALPDSPAKKAGLKSEDQLLQIGGNDVGDLQMTVKSIQQIQPGSELVLRIKRGSEEKDIKIQTGVVPFHFLLL